MAPTQPRKTRGPVASKAVPRKPRVPTRQRSGSWEVLDRQDSGSHDSNIENEDPAYDDASEQAEGHDPLAILQEMADRLGKEVETFAISLDKFLDDLQTDDLYDTVHDLVLEFKVLAGTRVRDLKATCEQEHLEELRREWVTQAKLSTMSSKSVLGLSADPRSTTTARVKELRKCQEEADTWELFRIVLEQHHRPDDEDRRAEKREKLAKLEKVNRYTSEHDIYERFLAEDDLGQERASIKAWLEQTAEHQQSGVGHIMEELQKRSKGGSGLWSRGWLNTREKIKGEKRLRTWPAPDSSPLPQLRSVSANELLVTSLDPDASNRQGRSLEQEDAFYERAMWITCWEMLRRGTSWPRMIQWCDEHKESWRAMLLGSGMVHTDAPSQATWRRMCYLASQGTCSNEYEAAVFGLLGGNVAAMRPVCHTVDDQLFAHYSANLIHQFNQYLYDNYPAHVQTSSIDNTDLSRPESAQRAVLELVMKMRSHPGTHSQILTPIKIVQSYLLANETESLINTVGTAVASTGLENESSAIARPRQVVKDVRPEAMAALNPICLRLVTHICIILQVLRTDPLDIEDQEMEDNLIVAYIQQINAAGKHDLIPTYASRLQKPCCIVTMAKVLPGISESRVKREVITLMRQKNMDVVAVLRRQLNDMLEAVVQESSEPERFSILQKTTDQRWPGQQIDLESFLDAVTPTQEALVRSLDWYLLLPGNWDDTFDAMAFAMRKLLVSGHFACARLLFETYRSSKVAAIKSYQVFGRTVHILADEGGPTDDAGIDLWFSMRLKAERYIDLEHLLEAFEAMFKWRTEEELYTKTGRALNVLPANLKDAYVSIQDAMEPLLAPGGYLLDAYDKAEEKDFAEIRRIYVTEAIIAYNVVLHAAGCMISRDALLTSMDLATVVATESTKLTETFTNARRMKELVTSFANTSKRILVLKNTGRAWKPKQERREGKNPAIWDIETRPCDQAELATAKS